MEAFCRTSKIMAFIKDDIRKAELSYYSHLRGVPLKDPFEYESEIEREWIKPIGVAIIVGVLAYMLFSGRL